MLNNTISTIAVMSDMKSLIIDSSEIINISIECNQCIYKNMKLNLEY